MYAEYIQYDIKKVYHGHHHPQFRRRTHLRISVITTKRAYEELEREGFLTTVPGKGCFVAPQNPELVREDTLRRAEEHLSHAVDVAKAGGVTLAELTETLNLLYGDETL